MDLTAATLGLDPARALDPADYAISGHAPRAAVRPATREEAAEALRAATRERLHVVPWGGGVSLPHDDAPPHYDVALDLRSLDQIVEYEPHDLTLTAECGVTIGALRAACEAKGQEFPIEAAMSSRATLGGALASNTAGTRRRRLGAPRDRILGARYLLGDGTAARTGGKVVKNVAGYGLHRMLCGSRGALAIVLEASLKLQPAPAARVALLYGCEPDTLRNRARYGAFPRLELAAVCVMSAALAREAGLDSKGASHLGIVGMEDEPAWVAEQERQVLDRFGQPLARLEGAQVAALWTRLTDLEELPGPRLTFTTSDDSPTAISPLLARVHHARYVFRCAAGRLLLWTPESEAVELAELLSEAGFTRIGARGLPSLRAPASPQVAVHDLRARLRAGMDPGSRFAYGERWVEGWL